MKKLLTVFLIYAASFSQKINAQQLKSEFLFEMEANLYEPQMVGKGLLGTRVIFPAKEGIVKGDRIKGKILAGGGDWGLILDSTTFKLDVRATIETDDGALIYMTYTGYIHTDAKRFTKILTGKANELSQSDYYFRTNPIFETSSPKYAWLNHIVSIGIGWIPESGKVSYKIFEIK